MTSTLEGRPANSGVFTRSEGRREPAPHLNVKILLLHLGDTTYTDQTGKKVLRAIFDHTAPALP
jgi:hypothetical protein